MTLLLKISPTPDSVVYSADKRLNDARGINDSYVKATRLGQFGVGGACGNTRSIHPETNIVQRDVHQQLREFFHTHELNRETFDEFLSYLREQHGVFLVTHRDGAPLNFDGPLFSMTLSSLAEGTVTDYVVNASVSRLDGLAPTGKGFTCGTGALMTAGDPEIVSAIRSLREPILADIFAFDDIRTLLSRPRDCPFGMVSVDRAIEICRFVNRVCSDQAEAITRARSTISQDCDVLLLDRGGVRQV
jgi:hypothetical protein